MRRFFSKKASALLAIPLLCAVLLVSGWNSAQAVSSVTAQNIYNMLRQKVAGDYLHTASIFDKDFHVFSGVNAPNDYHGPMTGYQLSEERWEQIKNIPNAIRPEDI